MPRTPDPLYTAVERLARGESVWWQTKETAYGRRLHMNRALAYFKRRPGKSFRLHCYTAIGAHMLGDMHFLLRVVRVK